MRILGFLALCSAVLGCSREVGIRADGDAVRGPQPDIVIEPPALQFPRLTEGETATDTFTITNRGLASLDVSALEVVTGQAAFTVAGPQVFELEIDQSLEFQVTFTPVNQDDNFGRIEVVSDDPDEPRAPLDLLGSGSVADLEIRPDNHVFGEAFVPCGDEIDLDLVNVGSEDIVIDGIGYESDDGDMQLIDIDDFRDDLPIRLAPGESRSVEVWWRPQDNGEDLGTLVVSSNDPIGDERAKQSGTGVYVGRVTETFTTPGVPPVDVMFLIDQSCSMEADNAQTLTDGLPAFFGKLRELSDWQLVQINSQSACKNGPIFDGSTPLAESTFSDGAFRDYFSDPDFPDEELSEALFKMAKDALDKTDPGECNHGFLREGSLLHIIVASDEREQSNIAWQTHVNRFEAFVADPDLLRISAIVDQFPNPPCADNGQGNDGYFQAANATNGAVVDICTSNWGNQLPDLAENVLEGVRSYNLANRAVGASIEVEVNGVSTSSFSYTDEARTVTVLDPPIGGGDEVSITYAIASNCGN